MLAGNGSLAFRSASTVITDTYGDTVDDAAPVAAGTSVAGLVEDNDNWNLSDIRIRRNVDVWASLGVDFTGIHTACCYLSLAVPDKAGDMFELSLWALHALHESKD